MPSEQNEHAVKNKKEQMKPLFMYSYLKGLGDRQLEKIENFYKSALEPCTGSEQSLREMKCEGLSLGCSFLYNDSPQSFEKNQRQRFDPLNPNIIGPRQCEYCRAESTLDCEPTCERPRLYFLKRKPPFETNDEEWTKDGYRVRDMEYFDRMKSLTIEERNTNGDNSTFRRFFSSEH